MDRIDLSSYKLASVNSVMSASTWNGLFLAIDDKLHALKDEVPEMGNVGVDFHWPDVNDGDSLSASDWSVLVLELYEALDDGASATDDTLMDATRQAAFNAVSGKSAGDYITQSQWNGLVEACEYVINGIVNWV